MQYNRKHYRKFSEQNELLKTLKALHQILAGGGYRLLWVPLTTIILLELNAMISRIAVAGLFNHIESGSDVRMGLLLIAVITMDMVVLAFDVGQVRFVIDNIGYRLRGFVSEKVINHVSDLGADFFNNVPGSKIFDRAGKAERVVNLVEGAMWTVAGNSIQAIFTIIVLLIIHPIAVLITLVAFFVFFRLNNKTIKRQSPIRMRRKDLDEREVSENMMRLIVANQTLVNSSVLDFSKESLMKGFRNVRRVGLKELGFVLTGDGILRDIVMFLARRGILGLTALMALRYDSFSIAEVVLIFTLTETMFLSVWGVVRFLYQLNHESANILKIAELFDVEAMIKEPENPIEIPKGSLSFRISSVNFTYPNFQLGNGDDEKYEPYKKKVESLRRKLELIDIQKSDEPKQVYHLRDINLEIESGQIVALVGSSGAGKSTLTNLLMKSRIPDNGTILINGVEVNQLCGKALRRRIAIVPQGSNIDLFNDTLMFNITLGDPKFSEEDVIEALKVAELWETVLEWDNLIYEMIGERGKTLSGGQQQRVAIARAVIRNPDLLILDEATSALDTETEREIQRSLDQLMKGRTAIVIAHRLSTIRNVDKIVVMDKGRIAEVGSWRELVNRDGIFAKLVDAQSID